jgi:acetyl esterase/lipase
MRKAGVPVDYTCYETTIHGFLNMTKVIPVAMDALDESAQKLKAALG